MCARVSSQIGVDLSQLTDEQTRSSKPFSDALLRKGRSSDRSDVRFVPKADIAPAWFEMKRAAN